MSSSRLRAVLVALALVAPLALSGCTGIRPVYGDVAIGPTELEFRYSEPESRLEQIIIQDLGLRLGRNDSEDAPLIRIKARTLSRDVTDVYVTRPNAQYEAIVVAYYAIVADGKTVGSGSRRATATYATASQVMANDAARRDALERAAHEAAEMIRLSILGDLATPRREAEGEPEAETELELADQ